MKQQRILEYMRRRPGVAMLIERLDCTLKPQEEILAQSHKVHRRIDDLVKTFEQARSLPRVERSIIHEGIWAPGQPPISLNQREREFQILSYLEAIYGPPPWKYPLPHAPF